MSDLISRQSTIDALRVYFKKTPTTAIRAMNVVESQPAAEPEIIYCRDCKNHIDDFFCCEAGHHTSDNGCCMTVFHAERRTDE